MNTKDANMSTSFVDATDKNRFMIVQPTSDECWKTHNYGFIQKHHVEWYAPSLTPIARDWKVPSES